MQRMLTLPAVGRAAEGWYNAGYIFPLGFQSRVHFRSSARPASCAHGFCSDCGLSICYALFSVFCMI